MVLFTVIGIMGLVCLLWAFFLAESGRTASSIRTYTLLNAAGSFLLIIYSIHLFAWVFTILNIIWFTVAVMALVRTKRKLHLPPHHPAPFRQGTRLAPRRKEKERFL